VGLTDTITTPNAKISKLAEKGEGQICFQENDSKFLIDLLRV
jgi:hypothetical protein